MSTEAKLHALHARGSRVSGVNDGTPIDLARLIHIPVPHTRVRYELRLRGDATLERVLAQALDAATRRSGEPRTADG